MRRRVQRSWSVLVVGFLLVVPLIVTCAWLYANDRWAPLLDFAVTELRVRDVGTVRTPLVGLFGRFGNMEKDLGSHPGPVSFYLLAPVYRLLGGSYWALRVSTATLNAAAIACAPLIAHRRAGVPGALAAGLGIAFLELGFGPLVLTEPWIPHVPILWFVVFLLAVWSVLSGDPWMLPVAAATASLCAQTHIPYLVVCGGIGLLALVSFAVLWVRAARRGSGRAYTRAFLAAVATMVVLWTPPLIEQYLDEPGNMTILIEYFRNALGPTVGFRAAVPPLLAHLDAVHLVVGSFLMPGGFTIFWHPRPPTPERGAVFLLLWVAAVVAASRLRNRSLLALHGVVAVSLLVCLMAISRIIGWTYDYLTYSAWVVGALMFLASVSTLAVVVWQRLPERVRTRIGPIATAAAVVAVGACAVRLVMETTRAGSGVPGPSEQLAALAPAAADALLHGDGTGTGVHGRYLVTWSETLRLAGEGWGLVNELERRGLHVGVPWQFGTVFTKHRVLDPKEATARIHLATGGWIDHARTIPGAIQIAYEDGRSTEARQEFERHRTGMVEALRRIGREDVAGQIDRQLDGIMVPGLHPIYAFIAKRMAEIGVPAAVFVIPTRSP